MFAFAMIVSLSLVSVLCDRTVQPPAKDGADCICKKEDPVCYCLFVIEHKLTMILEKERKLVFPDNGVLRMYDQTNDNRQLTREEAARVITADGETSRLVIAINGTFPGPRIEAWQNQTLDITFFNTFHTDSVTVHFHGIHQRSTPWMDGVAFISQCPILPGQKFVYRFKAYPPGTAMYHAHIGDQRSMGLYGPVIVRPTANPLVLNNEIIIALQDWNHLMDAETAYQRMITQQFDFSTGKVINTTYSIDRGQFSRFEFQSGLVNGKGRFWRTSTTNNGAPLETFSVESGTQYRFRIIGAMTLYPMRVYISDSKLTLRTSDAYNVDNIQVQSIIVHPGERYDFYWTAPASPDSSGKTYSLFLAETIETPQSLNYSKYHTAEAVLHIVDFEGSLPPNPDKNQNEPCTTKSPCRTFNCPYKIYPPSDKRSCITFDEVNNTDPNQKYETVVGNTVDEELFFNFGFPGPSGNTPGSVNGREFDPPSVSMLTQQNGIKTPCPLTCDDDICKCTYVQKLASNKLVQMIFSNIGNGSGWSHPVHLHGHSFYVMKMGFGDYDPLTGRLLNNSKDIACRNDYCNKGTWANESWAGGNIPNLNEKPPEKDTIVVPTGGYVVVRMRSDNPGMWFLHCHIDLHNTNGMGMVIDEGDTKPPTPAGFPTCGDFLYNQNGVGSSVILRDTMSLLIGAVALAIL